MKKKTIFIMLLSALLLTACAKDQEETGPPVVLTKQSDLTVQEKENQKTEGTVSTMSKSAAESTEKEPEPEKETTEASQSIPESTETSTRPKDTEETKKPEKNNSSAGQSKPANTGSSGSSGSNSSTGGTGNAGNTGNTEKNGNSSASTPHTACTYDGGKITKAADCNNEGVKTYTCTACGKTKTEAVAKTSHNYTTSTTAATCTANGSTKTYCTICGNVQSETTTAATGHSMHEEWFNEPTCLTGGAGHVNVCGKCGYAEGLPESAPLGHVPDAGTMWDPPDCCHEGHASHVCTRCNANLSDTVIPANPDAHDWQFDEEDNEWYCDNGCGATR